MLDVLPDKWFNYISATKKWVLHLTAHPQTETLVLSGDSSNYSYCANAERFSKLYGLLFNLLRQFTSWGKDHSIRSLIRVLNPVRLGNRRKVALNTWLNYKVVTKRSKTMDTDIKTFYDFNHKILLDELDLHVYFYYTMFGNEESFCTCQFLAGWWSRPAAELGRLQFYHYLSQPHQWCHGSVDQWEWLASG